jgi:hypothetical protein
MSFDGLYHIALNVNEIFFFLNQRRQDDGFTKSWSCWIKACKKVEFLLKHFMDMLRRCYLYLCRKSCQWFCRTYKMAFRHALSWIRLEKKIIEKIVFSQHRLSWASKLLKFWSFWNINSLNWKLFKFKRNTSSIEATDDKITLISIFSFDPRVL